MNDVSARTRTAPTVQAAVPGSRSVECCTRRQVLRGAGAASMVTASAALLSACGGGSSVSEATTAPDGTVRVPAGDTAVGESSYYQSVKLVVTQPAEGDFRAFDSTCPHQGCATSMFDDGQIVCPCHGSRFDPATGEVLAGPAASGLQVLEVTVDGGELVIRG